MKLAESELGKVPAPGRRPESDTLEMQGHPKGKGHPKGQPANENQLLSSQLNAPASTTTTSAPMDSNNQQQPAAQGSSSAPYVPCCFLRQHSLTCPSIAKFAPGSRWYVRRWVVFFLLIFNLWPIETPCSANDSNSSAIGAHRVGAAQRGILWHDASTHQQQQRKSTYIL
jgi:hypothetical protein